MPRSSVLGRVASSGRVSIPIFQNLALRSETFDDASWTKSSGSILANQVANPIDGAVTADAFVEDSNVGANTNRLTSQTITTSRGVLYAFSAYFKNADPTVPCILMTLNGGSSGPIFNLVTGAVDNSAIGMIESIGNGWYRCTAFLVSTALSQQCQFYSAISFSTISHVGTNGAVYYVWGAQLVQANWPGPYTPTVASAVNTGNIRNLIYKSQNLLIQSEGFDNATAWLKTGAAVSANTIANPVDGAVTADTLTASSGGTFHYTAFANSTNYKTIAPVGTGPFTFSVYVKKNNNNWIAIMTQDNHSGSNAIYFNVNTGVFGSTGANAALLGATARLEETLANGWYRVSVTVPKIQDYAGATAGFGVFVANADNGNSFSAAGTEAVYVFGAQLVNGNSAGPYRSASTLNFNYGAPRNLISNT